MHNIVLTINQSLQVAALLPTIVVLVYLLVATRHTRLTLLPIAQFLAISALFLPALRVFAPALQHSVGFARGMLFLESLIPAVSFLLIMQFLIMRVPSFLYWVILAVPIIGGMPFIYLVTEAPEICVNDHTCINSEYALMMYRILGTSLVFLLLLFLIPSKRHVAVGRDQAKHRQQYWLVITIIVFNVLLLAVNLARIGDYIKLNQANFVNTMIGISFIYLVMSSMFRVFHTPYMRPNKKAQLSPVEYALADKIIVFFTDQKIYREMGLSRAKLADRLQATEHQVSKVINYHFKKSFNELLNDYRLREAKELLEKTDQPVTVIAYDVGFSSLTSFNRVFKKATKVAASEYREKLRKPIQNSA